MQMMHADVFGFLVPFALLLRRICMLGTKEKSAVFLHVAAVLLNLRILPMPADIEGTLSCACLCMNEFRVKQPVNQRTHS